MRWLQRIVGHFRRPAPEAPYAGLIDLRLAASLFENVRQHVENFSHGEEAGFLLCSRSHLNEVDVLLAREWHPVPPEAIERNTDGSVLSWGAEFNSKMLERAIELDAAPILVHSHGVGNPSFSPDDRSKEIALFATFSRLLGSIPTGTVLLGKGDVIGSFWSEGQNLLSLRRMVVLGEKISGWPAPGHELGGRSPRMRLQRQSIAIGPRSDAKLAAAKVAVVGISGGGSHIAGQLAHQGVGNLIFVDNEVVDESNLGRLIGATEADVDKTGKTALARRVVTGIDSTINVVEVRSRFPSTESIEQLKQADVIVTCVDSFRAREAINAFSRRYLIPLVDIGIAIRSAEEHLAIADGQVIVSRPGDPCLRCWFVTDAVLEAEQRDRPPGYDENPDAPGDPQVVSMNGVLASEGCNCVLDLITGYSGGRRAGVFWQYEGRAGHLEPSELPPARPDCPACAEEGHGDPPRTAA